VPLGTSYIVTQGFIPGFCEPHTKEVPLGTTDLVWISVIKNLLLFCKD